MTAVRVKRTPLTALRPADFNPRSIAPERMQALMRSLAADPRMLEARPVIALPDGTVVCGNQRLLAARELGWAEIPAVTVDLDEEQARLWMLRDNNEYGHWEEDALAALLRELEEAGADLELAGFPESELESLLACAAKPDRDPDEAPPLPVGDPVSRPGEVYELGAHRLMCGDATDPEQVATLLAGAEPVLLLTDPPYGVKLDLEWRDRAGLNTPGKRRSRGHRNVSIRGDSKADWSDAFELVPSLQVAYVWHASRHAGEVEEGLRRIGFEVVQQIVWSKPVFVLGRQHYQWQHEPCWYARRKGGKVPWFGGRAQSTVWEAASPKRITGGAGDERVDHPTQKPVALFARPLENHLRRGGCFYEPFAGSGSSLVAAELTGRTCFAMELDPRYCDVVRDRYEALTNG